MRNLKRVLSLALALVMMLGMMIITTSAAEATTVDFADADEITNTEAVDVMVALGVIEGDGTNFNPTDILTREQAAKIICYMLMGPDNAEKLSKNTSIFTDVAAGRWSAGYIAYCANLGILAGNGDGTFDPTGKLTGVAFGKMLLTALGYDAEIEGYVNNANWATNIATDMIAAEIDVDGTTLDAPLSRDNACQMAFNTLTANTVYYSDKIDVNTGDATVTISGGRHDDGSATESVANSYADFATPYTQFCEKYFPKLTLSGTYDGMARPAHEWKIKNVSVGLYADEADYTAYVTAKNSTLAKVVDSFSTKFVDNTATVYVNGTQTVIPNPDTTTAQKRGNLVEIYMDANNSNKVDRIVVTHKTVAKLTNDAATKEDGTDTLVKVPGVAGLTGFNSVNTTEVVHGYQDLVKDDIVMFYQDVNGEYFIEKAESFEGVLTASTGTAIASTYKLTISGATYDSSLQTNTLNANGTPIDPLTYYKEDATWYTDNDGNVIWAEGKDNTVLAYVLDAETDTDIWSAETYYAKLLLLTDNTVATVQTDADYSTAQSGAITGGDLVGNFVKYSVKNDKYTLTDAAAYVAGTTGQIDGDLGTTDEFVITKGNPVITMDLSATKYVNSNANTIFFVRNYTAGGTAKDSFTTYTGYATVPSMDLAGGTASANNLAATATAVAYVNANTYAKYVVVDPGQNVTGVSVASDLFYVVDSTVTSHYDPEDGAYYWTVKAIKSGDETAVNLEFNFDPSAAVAANSSVAIARSKAYVVSGYDKDGRIDSYGLALTDGGQYKVNNGVSAENATTVRLNGTAYAANSETTVYYITTSGAVSIIGVADIVADGSDTYVAVMDDTTGSGQYLIDTLFIRQVNVSTPVVTGHLADQTKTSGVGSFTAPAVTVTAPGDGTLSYAWYVDGVYCATTGNAATMAAGDVPTAIGTYEVKCVITNTSSTEATEISSVTEVCTLTMLAP